MRSFVVAALISMTLAGSASALEISTGAITVYDGAMGDEIAKPFCPTGTLASIFIAPSAYSSLTDAPIRGIRTEAVDLEKSWRIEGWIQSAGQEGAWRKAGPEDMKATAFTKCG